MKPIDSLVFRQQLYWKSHKYFRTDLVNEALLVSIDDKIWTHLHAVVNLFVYFNRYIF